MDNELKLTILPIVVIVSFLIGYYARKLKLDKWIKI